MERVLHRSSHCDFFLCVEKREVFETGYSKVEIARRSALNEETNLEARVTPSSASLACRAILMTLIKEPENSDRSKANHSSLASSVKNGFRPRTSRNRATAICR